MKYLAIDTSGTQLTVILYVDGKIYSEFDKNCGVNHSVALMPSVEKLCEKANVKTSQLDFFASVVGAGSFTGIRIGISTVKALAFAVNKPILKITSFDTIAYNIEKGKNLAVIDAGHDGYYVAGYENNKVVFNPQYVDKETLLLLNKEYDFYSGSKIEGVKTKVVSLEKGLIKAIEVKKDEISYNYEDLAPLYCRKSQAEEGRK